MSSSWMEMEPMKVTVKHTFVDVPATRDFSLEGFLQEREIKSCPASRMVSLEEEPEAFSIPALAQAAMKFPKCSVPRDCTVDSLEEFFMDRESKSATNVPAAPMTPKTRMFMAPRDSTVDSLEEFFMDRESKPSATAFPAAFPEVGFPMNTAGTGFEFASFPSFFKYPLLSDVGDLSTVASSASSTGEREEARSEPETPELSDNETEPQGEKKLTISLTDGLCIESQGSAEHMAGTCKPCGFYWKPGGCQHGQNCKFCHLCPVGEVKRRKKEKLVIRKMARGFQNGFQNDFQIENQPSNFNGMFRI